MEPEVSKPCGHHDVTSFRIEKLELRSDDHEARLRVQELNMSSLNGKFGLVLWAVPVLSAVLTPIGIAAMNVLIGLLTGKK